jgi:hypothetical protein
MKVGLIGHRLLDRSGQEHLIGGGEAPMEGRVVLGADGPGHALPPGIEGSSAWLEKHDSVFHADLRTQRPDRHIDT